MKTRCLFAHFNANKSDFLLIGLFIFLSVILSAIPTGFENRTGQPSVRCRGLIIATDNDHVQQVNLIKTGDQLVEIKILSGPFKGKVFKANNPLLGRMDRDTLFSAGDTAFVVLSLDAQGNVVFVHPEAHYRIGLEALLLCLFAVLLVCFGGITGIKALLSFVFAALTLWKVLVPLLLKGWDPVILTLGITFFLCAVIILLVAGLNKKGATALAGSMLGILTSGLLSIYFTQKIHVHGAVLPFAEALLYSGFGHLSLTKIFTAAVFLACSGAVMDLAMDVAASMQAVVDRDPNISVLELMGSGLNVGRAVTGTMTTTLLFAYSGGYITLLMAFMAQGVPLSNTVNLIYVSSEILKTLIGSFGLVTVAPFTAVCGGFILHRK